MGSLYKRCPFRKIYCGKDCALYNERSSKGCAFLEMSDSIDFVCEQITTLLKAQERIISILEKDTAEAQAEAE